MGGGVTLRPLKIKKKKERRKKKEKTLIRNSNIELLRIILMFAIIAHHFVVNSGIVAYFQVNSYKTLYLIMFGMWGKTAINVFVLITGYFMCKLEFKWEKFLKLFLEIKFYRIIFFIIFLFFGYETLNVSSISGLLFNCIKGINYGFVGTFIVLYLLIPFLNKFIKNLDKNSLGKLILLLLFIFTIIPTFFRNDLACNLLCWYITLYFVASYIRLYPLKFMDNNKIILIGLLSVLILSYISVAILYYRHPISHIGVYYYFISDSNKILAFLVAVFMFLFFKNLKIKNSKFINAVSSTTFGVLLIHAASDAMRFFLWNDFLKVPTFYDSMNGGELVINSILVVIVIYVVCVVIDYFRIVFLERPFFKFIDKNKEKFKSYKMIKNIKKLLKGNKFIEKII